MTRSAACFAEIEDARASGRHDEVNGWVLIWGGAEIIGGEVAMRSEPAKMGTKGTRGRTRGPRHGIARNSMLRRIALEALEPRTLMAVVPTPTVLPNSQVDISTSRGDESSPTIAIDQ